MDLTKNPTSEQLAQLLAAADDNEGHHVLWVDLKGVVHLDLEENFDDENPQVRFRYEGYLAGNGYTGPEAAADTDHVKELLASLIKDWTSGATGYVDF